MYRLIIVEDEEVMRRGLSCYVPWEDMGFTVAGVFEDGTEAYEYLQKESCDVILTDIMMGRMSGLELAMNVCAEQPDIKVVILSGYMEFTYARQALQYKVVDYLVKPVDEDELADVFHKLKQRLDEEKRHQEEYGGLTGEYKLFVSELNAGNIDAIYALAKDFMERISYLPFEDIRGITKGLCSAIVQEYKNRNIDTWIITEGAFNIALLYESKDWRELEACLQKMLQALAEGLKAKEQDHQDHIVGLIKKYAQEHMNEDIGNEEIARKHNIHPAYMSRLFKQKTGETLTEYILRIRMEKAIELLREGKYKSSEISRMIGCSSQSYFTVLFKKYTGYNPSDYCRIVLKR